MRRGHIMPVQYHYLQSRESLRDRKSLIFCMRRGHKNTRNSGNLKFCVCYYSNPDFNNNT